MLRPCLEVGCPRKVRSGRCAKHARVHAAARVARKRASAPKRVYSDERWQQTRRRALDRVGHRCQAIENGDRCPEVLRLNGHHDYPGGVEQMLADGADPFDERFVVMLCGRHHRQVEEWLRQQNRRNRAPGR